MMPTLVLMIHLFNTIILMITFFFHFRWTKQNICLDNPTSETLELIPTVSNTNNFSLERDNERPIILGPHSQLEIPVHFMPSTLGQGDHLAKIIFHSEQVSVESCKLYSFAMYVLRNMIFGHHSMGLVK